MTDQNEYPKSVKYLSQFISFAIIAALWLAIVGSFIFAVISFWISGGSFGSWNVMFQFLGVLGIVVAVVLLTFISVIIYKKIYLWALSFIYMEIERREQREPLEEQKMKHKREVSDLKKLIKTLRKRGWALLQLLVTYGQSEKEIERDLIEPQRNST